MLPLARVEAAGVEAARVEAGVEVPKNTPVLVLPALPMPVLKPPGVRETEAAGAGVKMPTLPVPELKNPDVSAAELNSPMRCCCPS